MMLPIVDADGLPITKKVDQFNKQQRRRHDRFNGMSEDEVRSRTLPDHLTTNLDVVIVSPIDNSVSTKHLNVLTE